GIAEKSSPCLEDPHHGEHYLVAPVEPGLRQRPPRSPSPACPAAALRAPPAGARRADLAEHLHGPQPRRQRPRSRPPTGRSRHVPETQRRLRLYPLHRLLGSCAATEARADVIVAPNALTTVDGNSFADTPFSPLRLLQIFDSSQLTALGRPVLITQIAVRPDMIPGPSGPETRDTQWHLSTTTRSIASLVP